MTLPATLLLCLALATTPLAVAAEAPEGPITLPDFFAQPGEEAPRPGEGLLEPPKDALGYLHTLPITPETTYDILPLPLPAEYNLHPLSRAIKTLRDFDRR